MAGHRGQKFEGIRSHGTDLGGDGYIHPRSDKYRENFDNIKWNKCQCKGACKDCKCKTEETDVG